MKTTNLQLNRQRRRQPVSSVAVLPGRRRSARPGSRICAALPPRQEPVPHRVRRASTAAAGRTDARRRRDGVSGIREDDEGAAGAARAVAPRGHAAGLSLRSRWSSAACSRARGGRVPASAQAARARARRRPARREGAGQRARHRRRRGERGRAARRPRPDRRGHRHGGTGRGRAGVDRDADAAADALHHQHALARRPRGRQRADRRRGPAARPDAASRRWAPAWAPAPRSSRTRKR